MQFSKSHYFRWFLYKNVKNTLQLLPHHIQVIHLASLFFWVSTTHRHQLSVDTRVHGFTWNLALIGDYAAHKVRLSAAKVSHQLIKIFL